MSVWYYSIFGSINICSEDDNKIIICNNVSLFEEVLLVGYVPETHVELLTKSDWPASQCPTWLKF
jgi:hypothetical protein